MFEGGRLKSRRVGEARLAEKVEDCPEPAEVGPTLQAAASLRQPSCSLILSIFLGPTTGNGTGVVSGNRQALEDTRAAVGYYRYCRYYYVSLYYYKQIQLHFWLNTFIADSSYSILAAKLYSAPLFAFPAAAKLLSRR